VDFLRNAGSMGHKDSTNSRWLIADIGATNARCAILDSGEKNSKHLETYLTEDFDSLQALLGEFLSGLDKKPQRAALAVAAPIHGDSVQMINLNWDFSSAGLAKELQVLDVHFLNDYHAVAYALPALRKDQVSEIGKATRRIEGNRAVLGPGSGLGMAAWIGDPQSGAPMTGEGGHITMSARNEAEQKIIQKIRDRYGHCSAERILSGPGIIALHHAMHGENISSSREITSSSSDSTCVATMNQFFSFLGAVSAELALITGSFGGLYIGGGIVPACLEQLAASRFRERFEDKNRYKDYMQAIPTYVITDPTPGLTGLIAFITHEMH
jgi:glucokinase